MITIIFGLPGAGKTSLLAHFLQELYFDKGDDILDECRQKIIEANKRRLGRLLSIPAKAPIYASFKVKVLDGYETYFEPYKINPYRFGLRNDVMPVQYILPCGKLFISEGQKPYNSRQSSSFPSFTSNAFEEHRQYGIDFWIDTQRPILIDLNIRALCELFIEVRKMEHKYADNGAIESTTFYCREFKSNAEVEAYLETGEGNYTEKTYVHEGDIFEIFDSYAQFDDFLPEEGEDFINLEFLKSGEKPPAGFEEFYKKGEPKEYRAKKSTSNSEKKKEKKL